MSLNPGVKKLFDFSGDSSALAKCGSPGCGTKTHEYLEITSVTGKVSKVFFCSNCLSELRGKLWDVVMEHFNRVTMDTQAKLQRGLGYNPNFQNATYSGAGQAGKAGQRQNQAAFGQSQPMASIEEIDKVVRKFFGEKGKKS